MSLMQAFFERAGGVLSQHGQPAFAGEQPLAVFLPTIANTLYHELTEALRWGDAEFQQAFEQLLHASTADLEWRSANSLPPEVVCYLQQLPAAVRRTCRRPSDPDGDSLPRGFHIDEPVDLLAFLPSRPCQLQRTQRLAGLGNWELNDWIGNGRATEVWQGWDERQPERSPNQLKFIYGTDEADTLRRHAVELTELAEIDLPTGVIPIRAVHLDTDPVCIETDALDGYDLTGCMRELHWQSDKPRPEVALKLVRRIAQILAGLHRLGLVHRDLKPSNILFKPTGSGKFTLWVSDLGWGALSAEVNLEHVRHGTRSGEYFHEAINGAHTPLYASPQQIKRHRPDPRDDVYALGSIWYQLLTLDPHASPPVGHDWYGEFAHHGFSEAQAHLLESCLATRPDRRPANGQELLERIEEILHPPSKPTKVAAHADEDDVEDQAVHDLTLRNALGMCFMYVKPGSFAMGSDPDEYGHREDEGPKHPVTLRHGFYLGGTPVTQAQFAKLMGFNPSKFQQLDEDADECPVEQVTWEQAVEFCVRLSELSAEQRAGRTYRLPTEAEWEYACRAGSKQPYAFGSSLSSATAHFAEDADDPPEATQPVARTMPNGFHLQDMHGNVLEWCQDWYDEYYYFESPAADPQGPARGMLKVARGGCWMSRMTECRAAARMGLPPEHKAANLGFRVVLVHDHRDG